jgi:hypothetical protein
MGPPVTDADLLACFRQALLMMVDAIERKLGIAPRTAELRKQSR